jgi:hypothetical protein
MKGLWFCLVILPVTAALAAHNTLLPRPQQIHKSPRPEGKPTFLPLESIYPKLKADDE